MPTVAVIHNPVAGRRGAERALSAAVVHLEQAGWTARPTPTQHVGHAAQLAAELANEVERIVVVGGDGTLREVAQGILAVDGSCSIGLVPVGHGNVVARELKIPLDPKGASAVAAGSNTVRLDAMRVGGATALAMVGIGYDALIVADVDRARHGAVRKHWYAKHGDSLYAAAGIAALLSPKPRRFRMSVDGGAPETFAHGLVCNIATYAKDWAVIPDADPSDGQLDWHMRRAHGPIPSAVALISAKRKRSTPAWAARSGRGRRYLIEALGRPFVWQVDGDPQGESHRLEIEVVPSAVTLVAP
tara:strand:+ start:1026 stop:1931 length:906 start_codon:yes stop_codon:yes gene_type:complete